MNLKNLAVLSVALVVGFVAGVFYVRRTAPAESTTDQTMLNSTSESSYYPGVVAVEPCLFFQCLFKVDDQVIGYAQLDGYYRAVTVTGGGIDNVYEGITQTCDRFVVTGGSEPLIERFRNLVTIGNTLHKIEDGSLIINLDLTDENLDPALVARIRASTESDPISLGVLQRYLDGKGAAPCTSILRVVNENRTI